MPLLDEDDLYALLLAHPEWRLAGGTLVREWAFPDFSAAIAFVNRIASLAEELNHHPDIDVRYTRVRLALVSHDLGALTHRDARFLLTLDASLRP